MVAFGHNVANFRVTILTSPPATIFYRYSYFLLYDLDRHFEHMVFHCSEHWYFNVFLLQTVRHSVHMRTFVNFEHYTNYYSQF